MFYKTRELADKEFIQGQKILTTEEGKMYNLYILNGYTNKIEVLEDNNIFDYWFDHCINPLFFSTLADKYDCIYSDSTFHHIVEEYNCNYLNIDHPLGLSVDGHSAIIQPLPNDDKLYLTYDNISFGFKSLTEINHFLERKRHPHVLINDLDRSDFDSKVLIEITETVNKQFSQKVDGVTVNIMYEKVVYELMYKNSEGILVLFESLETDLISDLELLNVIETVYSTFDYPIESISQAYLFKALLHSC